MKFKDMVEGKKYVEHNGDADFIYTKKNGLLYNLYFDKFSHKCCATIAEMDFDEHHEYVSLEKAMEHMEKGGIARHDYGGDYKIEDGVMYYVHANRSALFSTQLLDGKWELL